MVPRAGIAVLATFLAIVGLPLSCAHLSWAQATRGWLVRILPDGSVSPPYAPLTRVGRVYYLTEDLEAWGSDGIIIEASGIVLNGMGHALRGDGTRGTRGVLVKGSNVEVANLVVEAFHYGVMVTSVSNVMLSNVTVAKCSEGILVANSSAVRVVDSRLLENVAGVNMLFSNLVEVAGNRVEGGAWGLYVMNSSETFLARNTVIGSSWGLMLLYSSGARVVDNEFWWCGAYVRGSYNNVFVGNRVNGKPLVYLERAEGVEVREAGQVVLVRSKDIRVSNVSISQASVGVLLYESYNTVVEFSNLTQNSWGVMLHTSSNNTIRWNWVEGNDVGIYLYDSRGNTIVGNVLLKNGLGLWLACSAQCTVHSNCFIVNRMQASAGCGENQWVSVEGGNYWSDGSDVDLNGDGFADEEYRINMGNIDKRPLTTCQLKRIQTLPSPSCTLTLLSQEAEVHVGEYFTVTIKAESPLPLKSVRFEIRAAERWETENFAWDLSSGTWDAVRKAVRLSVRTPGTATIEAFLKDAAGRQTSCTTTVNVMKLGQEEQREEAGTKTSLNHLKLIAAAIAAACLAVTIARIRKRRTKVNSAK